MDIPHYQQGGHCTKYGGFTSCWPCRGCEDLCLRERVQNFKVPDASNHNLISNGEQMALQLPFTYYRCSCVDTAPSLATRSSQKFTRLEDEEQTFDPKSPRANYSLFPLEHLLYCTECHQVRCSRCILEEIVCWYCPSCLFEVPSSTVRSEGNR
jgi:hypothetical protein